MLDPNLLRTQPELVAAGLARRGFTLDLALLRHLDDRRKALQVELENLRNERNRLSKAVGMAKRSGEDALALQGEATAVSARIATVEEDQRAALAAWDTFVQTLPNLPDAEVPDGRDENDNVELRRWGEPRTFDFAVRDHVDIAEQLGMADFAAGARLAGSRFVVLK
ncbi:serine--tRNA ligase, partial [Acidithiobacillus caldus]|nr:serine--tRNA ligase [Acidithiobacillus caldus]